MNKPDFIRTPTIVRVPRTQKEICNESDYLETNSGVLP